VTADGRLLRASANEHPDLFWALRGGGGNFGVATAFQFRLRPAGMILGGAVIYPASRAVLRGWADYASQAPDELTTITFVMPAPPAPFIPADQVGKLVAIIGVCYAGDLEAGQRVVEPLRKLGQPMVDISGPMPYPAMFSLTQEATRPQPHAIRSGYLNALEDAALETILEHAARMPLPFGLVQLRALGGAMARVPAEATAFAHRDKRFLAAIIGGGLELAHLEPQRAWTEQLWAALRPHAAGAYSNFLEDEGDQRVHEAYPAETYARLARIKRQYDPSNLFQLNQNIRPAD
jgi:hypothetical protein